MSIFQTDLDDEPPVNRNIFPARVLSKLTKLCTIKLEGQAVTGPASALSCLSQLHTLEM